MLVACTSLLMIQFVCYLLHVSDLLLFTQVQLSLYYHVHKLVHVVLYRTNVDVRWIETVVRSTIFYSLSFKVSGNNF